MYEGRARIGKTAGQARFMGPMSESFSVFPLRGFIKADDIRAYRPFFLALNQHT